MLPRVLVLGALLLYATAADAQQALRGRALDAETRAPVPGVLVTVVGQSGSAISRADGTWVLRATAPARVRAQHVGYAQLEVTVENTAPALELALEPVAVTLNDLVITASRRGQRLKDAPVAIELVSEREIRESGAADVAGLLLERTGIDVQAGMPNGTGAMLQGFGSERVLVLLDGQPLTGRLSGNFDLSRMPASTLERVEVVKGPQSTLFGSDALGGVINLITRQAGDEWSGAAGVVAGSDQRRSATVRAQGVLGALRLSGDGGHRTIGVTPGIAQTGGAQTDQWDALLKGNWRAGAALELEGSALLIDERQRWQSGQLFNFADNVQSALRATLRATAGAHRFTPTVHFSNFDHHARRATSDRPGPGGEREAQRLLKTELLYGTSIGRSTIDAGLELRRESIESPRVQGRERNLDGAETFAQLTVNAGPLSIVPGLRYSATREWGSHWTPRIALLHRPVESLALRLSVGSGFRAPAFKELHMQFLNVGPGFGYLVRGNPSLRPESSQNVSGGVEWTRPAWSLRAHAFHNRFDDFIETTTVGDSSGLTVYSYGNVEEGTTSGIELETTGAWKALRGEVSYGWLRARDRATGLPLLGRPVHSARAQLGYASRIGTRVSLAASYTGNTPLQREANALVERSAYTRVDARIAHALPRGIEASFGVDNLFDATPKGWPGYTGRQLYAGINWEMGR